ncbi:hypothetical protein AWC38_SpisGene17772 [Stylophora pistillata]|uniref:DNA-directed DNA polymerase n=1 Tax=Stylophora pistillata TaxID=50429 RepID=A0A2B4RL41_STYPI|nr:hypothetical protein AWC38_SpisGene17772 [Stylophora pistillata]
MLSGIEGRRRRRAHSEEAPESVRKKNSRSGCLSRVTMLYHATEVLLSDPKNVDKVKQKLLEIDEAFSRFEQVHYEYISTPDGDMVVWGSEARYFKEHFRRKMDFVSGIERWIQDVGLNAGAREENEIPVEDSVSTANSSQSSHSSRLSIRQLKANQAIAQLKLYQLKKRQELLRQEEETKLELELLDVQFEIRKTGLQIKLLQDEKLVDLAKLPNVFEDLKPFSEGVIVGAAHAPHQEYSNSRVELNVGSQDLPLRLKSNAQEYKSWSAGPTAPFVHPEATGSVLPGGVMHSVALTMKQGFALPKSIVNNAASESEKLMYLPQYISGAANDIIKCCLVMDPSLGYQRARELLQERFGHPFTIASKYVTRLTEGPPLKPGDRAGLLAFADKLKDCEHTLESIGYLDEINSADNLRGIVQRLPYHLRTKLVEVADEIQQTGQRTNISHIAEFVKVKARVANNPVFGCVVDIARDRSENERRNPKSRSATLTGERDKSFEERLEIMKKAQLCFNCFKYGHIGVGCLAKGACEVPGCKRRHHTLLHPPSPPPAVEGSDRVADKGTQAESGAPFQSGQTKSTSAGEGKVCLRVVLVKVRGHDDASKTIETYALLDGGSDISLCDKKLAVDLGAQGRQKTFDLTTQEKKDSPRVGHELSLVVEPLDGCDRVNVVRLWTVNKLNASGRSIPSEQDLRQWPHLRDIKLPSTSEKEVRLIIGTNVPDAFWVLEEKRGNKGEPYAIRTPLGWTIMGPMHKNVGGECHLNVNFVGSAEPVGEKNDCPMHQLERFWEVENYGVVPQSKLSMSVEDKRALEVMDQSVKLEHGHYQIALPWRNYPPVLPYNRCMAAKRLLAPKGRFMQDVLNKPGKTRAVFDCAAKHKGTSLNDQLLTGPDLTNSIVGVLMRSREEQVALSADIECMLHQVRVVPSKITKNPGRKAVAKLMLNSFWGKFGQQTNKSQTCQITEARDLLEMLDDPLVHVQDIRILSPEIVEVLYQRDASDPVKGMTTNIFIAAFTTALARLKLYESLERVQQQVLYNDTDSVVYRWKPGDAEIPLGDYLGDMTNEMD